MTIAQYSFKLGVLSTPSKIVGGAGIPPAPPLLLQFADDTTLICSGDTF